MLQDRLNGWLYDVEKDVLDNIDLDICVKKTLILVLFSMILHLEMPEDFFSKPWSIIILFEVIIIVILFFF
jgi:hypothetical protein